MDSAEYVRRITDANLRIRELEQALDEAPSRDRLRELEADCAVHRRSRDEAWARVAELERQLDEARSPKMHEYGDECYEFVADNPPEREAE